MTLEALRTEYRAVRIGPAIVEEVRHVVHTVIRSRNYDPQVYAGAPDWDSAEEDVVQGVITDLLLIEGQLDYLMGTATAIADWQTLLHRQVRRYLARRRQRTIIDNLLERAVEILEAPPFESSGGALPQFRIAGGNVEVRAPTDSELLAAARSAALVGRIPFSKSERAPVVYTREALAALLEVVARSLPCRFSRQDLDRLLRLVLTDWVAGFLYDIEAAQAQPTTELSPEDEVVVREAAARILKDSSREQLLVLRRKLEQRSDAEIADELGVSRPTVAARKQEVFGLIRSALDGLPERVQTSVMDQVSVAVARAL